MKKNQKIILVVLIAVLFIFGGLYSLYGFQLPSFSATGENILSIQNAQKYISEDPFYDGEVISLTMASTGSGRSLEADVTPSLLSKFGITTSETAHITLTKKSEMCKYLFTDETHVIKKATASSYRPNWLSSGVCDCNMGGTLIWAGGGGSNYYICDHSTCQKSAWNANAEGTGVGLEYSAIYDIDLEIKIEFADGTVETLDLSQTQLSDSIPNFARAYFIGSLMGQQSCPSVGSEAIAWKPRGSNTFTLKNKYLYNAVLGEMAGGVPSYSMVSSYNSKVNAFLASTSNLGQICTFQSPETEDAYVECTPSGVVAVPIILLEIKASEFGEVVPVGQPQILSATVSSEGIEAGDFMPVKVSVKNSGQQASFDVSVLCPTHSPNPFSTRDNINAGETKDVIVNVEGAGYIEECTIKIVDVNNPEIKDEKTQLLTFYPFCEVECDSNHIKVFTEFGCECTCPNAYDGEVDSTCQFIGNSVPEKYTQCKSNESVDNTSSPVTDCPLTSEYKAIEGRFICSNEGKFRTVYNYLKWVIERGGTSFIPEERAGYIWISYPICDYHKAYSSANFGTSYSHDYGKEPVNAVDEDTGTTAPSDGTGTGDTGDVVDVVDDVVDVVDDVIDESMKGNYQAIAIVLGVITLIIAIIWYFKKKM